ncbi:two-component system sensor histidine kinase NtrB [Crateriforma conspicua]|uniref:histidine kinase n=1 Tax=Crateriforma conspicua TaxID=2527996 RepID=A0A5C5XT05_9PLAN|nr:ATP-binding protein [Crateriforma conspicua]TWT65463.1 Sensor protein ZraS [Crateriforma conspicua]
MFRSQRTQSRRNLRFAVFTLLLLSVCSLLISLWFVVDFGREQEIVKQLVRDLPDRDLPVAAELTSELKWQSRWTFFVILQVIATGLAVALLFRAYLGSQERLNDIKALAGDILSSMEQAVITSDTDGLVTSLNERAIQFLGVSGDPVGKSLRQLTDQIDLASFRAETDSLAKHSLMKDFAVKKNGENLWLRAFCQPLCDANGKVIGNVFQLRDVTADRHLHDRAARMERFMGLGSLAVGLHHEIKNPLAAVSLHVQLVEEALAELSVPDEVPEMLSIVKSEMKRTGQVLETFRDYASANRLDLTETPIVELLTRQIDLLRPVAEANKVTLDLSLSPNLPEQIPIDAARVEQIIHNLMLNAIQAMPEGGTLSIQAKAAIEADSHGVLIKFSDTGKGIPESIRPHIFDAYFTTKGGGTGMGLALSDKIARQHGGRLDLASVDGGTTFELFLPKDPDGQTT